MSDQWRPSAHLSSLKARSQLYQSIRTFFYQKNYLEVDVPLLSRGGTTDPFIESFQLQHQQQTFYLQTSPEFAMKRLLSALSGSIFSLSKAFRQEERGRFHNPEFTLLEWYRLGFDDHQLMAEVAELLGLFFDYESEKISYQEIFETYLSINPHKDSIDTIKSVAKNKLDIHALDVEDDKTVLLDLLFSHCIQTQLTGKVFFIYDYPEAQSALARKQKNIDGVLVARRFEVFIDGVELANGYWELSDADELKTRFENDNAQRKKMKLPSVNYDENLLQAMTHGLPDCAGVALGVDRLLMLIENAEQIDHVIAFPFDRV